jgi:hypothetical protein
VAAARFARHCVKILRPRSGSGADKKEDVARAVLKGAHQMPLWDDWSTVRKTRAVIGVGLLGGLLLYGAFADAMNW